MITPADYVNSRTRLLLRRKPDGLGVVLPASNTLVRIVRDAHGHLGLEVHAPPDVVVLREELADRLPK